jgi:hypothetical protein
MAVAIGINIVTENWVEDSVRRGRFLSFDHYLPQAVDKTWRCDLKEAVERGKNGLTRLLDGTTVYFTQDLRQQLGILEREMAQIATMLGADSVERRLPALKNKDNLHPTSILIIGVPRDRQGAHIGRLGQPLFNKDILPMAALRGQVERNSPEFLIETPVKDEEDN